MPFEAGRLAGWQADDFPVISCSKSSNYAGIKLCHGRTLMCVSKLQFVLSCFHHHWYKWCWRCLGDSDSGNGLGDDDSVGDNGLGDGDNDDGDPFAVVHVVWQPFRTAHSYHVGKIAQDCHIIFID